MILRGIDFGTVWGASGVQGFFGEGYPIHKKLGPLGPDFKGMTFVAKTTTLSFRPGNMSLNDDHTPEELLPKCIVVKPLKGVVLNAVGLSGPGARVLLADGRWMKRINPFFISFMSVADKAEERASELKQFVEILGVYLSNFPTFRKIVGLQINYSCPNVGLHSEPLIGEIRNGLDIASVLQIPLVPKLNLLVPAYVAIEISRHDHCDAICISNTIPWRTDIPWLPKTDQRQIDWNNLFGKKEGQSPLILRGFKQSGGLSGKPLLPILLEWLKLARARGFEKPINAGGGILSIRDAQSVFDAGGDSISIGSVAILRPWRVQRIIRSFQKQGLPDLNQNLNLAASPVRA